MQSAPGVGSTFTLYLPQTYVTPGAAAQERSVAHHARCCSEQGREGYSRSRVDVILPRHGALATEELVEDLVIDDDRNLIAAGRLRRC